VVARPVKALTSMLLMQAAVVAAATAPPVLAPVVAADLGVPATAIGYYASVMIAGAMLSVLLATGFVYRFGPVRTCQAMLLIAAFGLAALPTGELALVAAGAVLVGLAYGAPNPASSHLLARTTPPRLRSRVFSLKQTSMPIGAGAAGLAVPLLQDAWGWRAAALVVAGLCLVGALLAQAWRDELDDDRSPRAQVVGRGTVGALLLVLRAARLRRLVVVAWLFSMVQFSFTAFFVTYLADRVHLNLAAAGQALSAAMAASIGARVFWGWVADRHGARAAILAMAVLMAAAAGLAAMFTPAWPYAAVVAVAALFGATAVAWNGVFLAEIARLAPAGEVAAATGGALFCTFGGALVGPSVFGMLVAFAGGAENAFLALAAVGCVAALVYALPTSPDRSDAAAAHRK
jgi:MFS family permease